MPSKRSFTLMVLICRCLIGSYLGGVSEADLWVTLKLDFENYFKRVLFSGRVAESAVKISESR